MMGRRATVGLSLLFALLFCAIAAQGASAATAINTTAVTCSLGGGNLDFKDAHCDNQIFGGQGFYGHEPLPLDNTTELAVTSEKTQGSTGGSTPAVFKGTVFGAAFELTCTKISDASIVIEKQVIHEATIHNVEDIFKGHTTTGQIKLRLSSCTVSKPAKCVIAEPLDSAILEFRGREELGPEKNQMGIEFNGGGPAVLFTITFENKGEEKCGLAKKTVNVEGSAMATSGTGTQTGEYSGSTLNFTDEMTTETLKIGGNKAAFSTSLTPTMAGGNPIAFTTTT